MLFPPLEIQPHFQEKISWKPDTVAYIVEAGVMSPTWSPHSLTSSATWTPTLSRGSSKTVFKKCCQGPQNDHGLVQYIISQSVGLYKLNSTTSSYLTHSCCRSVLSSSDLGTPTIHSVVRNAKWLPSYWSMRSVLQAFHGSSAIGCHILSYCVCGVFNKWYLNDLKYWI